MLIGRLSEQTGCNIETVRYYERIGVMPKPPRTAGGHRVYADDHVKRLTFILRSRELGFTLAQVRDLLALVDGNDYSCDEVKAVTVAHADEVRRKIKDLNRLKRVLDDMAAQCDLGAVPDCPVIEALFERKTATV